ncbi:MAG: MoaD/ThiS family protein [Planctomycetes bacterium]|nr:MoaD/ThiS family protein [Planctomycetota bacterium]
MKITVRLFAKARELAGRERIEVEIPVSGRVADLKRSLVEQWPQMSALAKHLLVAVGTNYADDQTVLSPADEIACFPPVSGG